MTSSLLAWFRDLHTPTIGRDARRPHPDPLVEARLLHEDQLDSIPRRPDPNK